MADPAQFAVIDNAQFGVLPSGHLAIFNGAWLACDCCNDPPCDPDWGDSKGPTAGSGLRIGAGTWTVDEHKITVEAGADYYTSASVTNGFSPISNAIGPMSTSLAVWENFDSGDGYSIIASTVTGEDDTYGIGFFWYPPGGGAAVELWNSGEIGFQPDGLWQIKVTPTTVHFTGSIYTNEFTRTPADARRKCEVLAVISISASADHDDTAMDYSNFVLETPIPPGL